MGLGGEALGGGAAFLVAFFALWKMGASFFTSSSGADDSPLLSESDIVVVGGRCCGVVFGLSSQSGLFGGGKLQVRSQGASATSEREAVANGPVANGGEGQSQ